MKKLWIIIKHAEIPWKFFMTLIPPHISRRLLTLPFFPFLLLCDFPSSQPFFSELGIRLRSVTRLTQMLNMGRIEERRSGGSQRPCVMTYSFHLRPLLTRRLVLCLLNNTMGSLLLCSIVIIYHSDIVIYMCVPNTQIVHIFSTTFTITIIIIISDQLCQLCPTYGAHFFEFGEKTSLPFKWLTLIRLYCFTKSSSQKSWN